MSKPSKNPYRDLSELVDIWYGEIPIAEDYIESNKEQPDRIDEEGMASY